MEHNLKHNDMRALIDVRKIRSLQTRVRCWHSVDVRHSTFHCYLEHMALARLKSNRPWPASGVGNSCHQMVGAGGHRNTALVFSADSWKQTGRLRPIRQAADVYPRLSLKPPHHPPPSPHPAFCTQRLAHYVKITFFPALPKLDWFLLRLTTDLWLHRFRIQTMPGID